MKSSSKRFNSNFNLNDRTNQQKMDLDAHIEHNYLHRNKIVEIQSSPGSSLKTTARRSQLRVVIGTFEVCWLCKLNYTNSIT